MNEGRGGHWNRSGRRSGGSRPIPIVIGTQEPTEAERAADTSRELFAGIRARSPIWCIVAYALAAYGDEQVRAAMIRAGVGVPPTPHRETAGGAHDD